MEESSVSEHGFHLKDAEHERGTNRYVFSLVEFCDVFNFIQTCAEN